MGKTIPSQINTDDLAIIPLSTKAQLKGAFVDEHNPEFQHLTQWLKTWAVITQRERKAKTYLAYIGTNLIGYVTVSNLVIKLGIPDEENRSNLEPSNILLGKLYVAENARGQGIGKIMLDFVIDIASNLDEIIGCQAVVVDANPNERTINFYERYGFVPIGDHDDELRMVFVLPH